MNIIEEMQQDTRSLQKKLVDAGSHVKALEAKVFSLYLQIEVLQGWCTLTASREASAQRSVEGWRKLALQRGPEPPLGPDLGPHEDVLKGTLVYGDEGWQNAMYYEQKKFAHSFRSVTGDLLFPDRPIIPTRSSVRVSNMYEDDRLFDE